MTELDAETLDELRQPEVAPALTALGVALPDEPDLDELAAEYFSTLLQPAEGGPLVQSLWTEGTYEGRATKTVRELAAAAGLEFDRDPARGAPPDHLGAILLLWCAARERRPEVAERLEREHLAWALPGLERAARRGGFYGPVAGAAAELVRTLTGGEEAG